jgi:hypothetical protein
VKRLAVITIAVGLTLVTAASAQAAQILDKDIAYDMWPAYAQAWERNWDQVVFTIGAKPGQGISFGWTIVCRNGWDQSKSGRVRAASKVWVVHPPLHTRCQMNLTAQLVDQTGRVHAIISVK